MEIKQKLEAAALLLGCQVDDFLAHGERSSGDLVVIARDGKKFVFSVERLGAVNLAEPKAEPDPKGGQKPPERDIAQRAAQPAAQSAAQPTRQTVTRRAAIKSAPTTSRSKPQ